MLAREKKSSAVNTKKSQKIRAVAIDVKCGAVGGVTVYPL